MPERYSDDRIGRLEAATERLSQSVVGLSTSLALVNEISIRQAELEKRAAISEALSNKTAETAVDKKYVDEANAVYRKKILQRVFGIGGLTALVIAVLAIGAIGYTQQQNDRLRASKQTLYSGCLVRNKQGDALRTYLEAQIKTERTNPFINDTVRRQRIAASSALLAAYPPGLDCKRYLK